MASKIMNMKKLETLILNQCNITDKGLIDIIVNLDELGTVE